MESVTSHDALERRTKKSPESSSHPTRLLLEVIPGGDNAAASRAHLTALLRSPLGVYVTRTDVSGENVRAQLDIAPEDLDFTLHMLVSILPDALIGPAKQNAQRETAWRIH
ncbi:hypothetical protein [Paraburkholderia sp.]|uniref:hypothetical protein n=1 Tax=Paraburkholderia sp. TaxID=1926495 RepID=UPI003D6F2BF1